VKSLLYRSPPSNWTPEIAGFEHGASERSALEDCSVEIQTLQNRPGERSSKVNNFAGLTDDPHLNHPNPSDR
jgi:hypothetical protein